MEHFFPKFRLRQKKKIFINNRTLFPQIQVKTKKKVFIKNRTLFFPQFMLRCTPHQTVGGCRCGPFPNYWGGYSQIIVGDISPSSPPPCFGTPDSDYTMLADASECRLRHISFKCNKIYLLFGRYFTEW